MVNRDERKIEIGYIVTYKLSRASEARSLVAGEPIEEILAAKVLAISGDGRTLDVEFEDGRRAAIPASLAYAPVPVDEWESQFGEDWR